jgi:hypothetical protein
VTDLDASGLPVSRDQTTAWSVFGRWREQYAEPLHTLGRITGAPIAAWSCDGPSARPPADPPRGHKP